MCVCVHRVHRGLNILYKTWFVSLFCFPLLPLSVFCPPMISARVKQKRRSSSLPSDTGSSKGLWSVSQFLYCGHWKHADLEVMSLFWKKKRSVLISLGKELYLFYFVCLSETWVQLWAGQFTSCTVHTERCPRYIHRSTRVFNVTCRNLELTHLITSIHFQFFALNRNLLCT